MYRIGIKNIEIENLYSSQPVSRLAIFHTNEYEIELESDIIYNVKYVESIIPNQDDEVLFHSPSLAVTRCESGFRYYHLYEYGPLACTVEESSCRYSIILSEDIKNSDVHRYFFPELLHLEKVFSYSGFFVLHSAYIVINDRAILFTAQSGGGKSTQSDLWHKYREAEIVNGDKALIGKENGVWKVFGLPFSGGSEYCSNKTCTLGAIVILDKSQHNNLQKVAMEGFSKVFSQVIQNPWDQDYTEKVMDQVIQLCDEIPVYEYACTISEAAVDVLYNELTSKGIIDGCK